MAGYDRIKRVFSLFGTRRDISVRYFYFLPSSVLTISYVERACQNRILSGYFHFQVCCELLWTSAPLTLLMGGSRAGRLDLWGKRGGPETKMSVALVGDEVPLVGTAPTEARPSVAR
jgi:hypothetical protein